MSKRGGPQRDSDGPLPLAYKETGWLQEGHKAPLYGAAFNHVTPDLGDLLATVGSNRATVYQCHPSGETEVLQVFRDVDPHEEYYVCQWSVDLRTGAPLLLLGGHNGLLQVVNCATGVLECTLEGHGKDLHDVAVHPTQPQFVATASKDQSLRVWNIATRVCALVLSGEGGHRNDALSVCWQPARAGSGFVIVSSGMDSHIKIWDLERYQETLAASKEWRPCGRAFPTRHVTRPAFSTQRVHFNYVDCVRWLGAHLVSKSTDDRLIVWHPDYTSPKAASDGDINFVQDIPLEGCRGVWWVRFALDYWCTVLAAGTSTGRVLVYDPHSQQQKASARLLPRRASAAGGKQERAAALVRQTAVSFDGSIIVSCHDDGSLTRYDRCERAPSAAADSRQQGSTDVDEDSYSSEPDD